MKSLSKAAYIPRSKITNAQDRKANKPIKRCESDEELSIEEEELKQFDEVAKEAKFSKKKFKKQVDTNVVALDLSVLNLNKGLATGDPIKCSSCGAYLSKFSKIEFQEKLALWPCEFCSTMNKLNVEKEELPKEDQVTYILEKVIPKEEEKVLSTNDPIIVFCIDISGSMDCNTKSSIISKYSKTKGLVTRLDCVKLAIDKQLCDLRHSMPKAKVGFITFEESVVILGDGMGKPFRLEETSYENFFAMIEKSVSHSTLIDTPVAKSAEGLLHELAQIRTGGSTALGPGLTCSVAVASRGGVGSKVILCTDGLANKGIGTVESSNPEAIKKSTEFYETLGSYAKEHGVVVTLVSIVESECKLEMLSPVATKSGGDIVKVDPQNLDKDFKEFLSERVLASNVEIKIRVHPAMEFRNVVNGVLESNNAILKIDVGNVTESTKISFEYKVKASEEIAKMEKIDLQKMASLPFQAVIQYKTSDNLRCLKILSMEQSVTTVREEAEKDIQEDVLLQHAKIQTVGIAKAGNYEDAMNEAVMWNKYSKKAELKTQTKKIYGALTAQNKISGPMSQQISSKMEVNDDLTVQMNQLLK
jgi:hypothetical protein